MPSPNDSLLDALLDSWDRNITVLTNLLRAVPPGGLEARARNAVRARIESGRALDRDVAHPLLLVQLLIFHEGYHHGQVKLALKGAGIPIPDDVAGPATWDVWRAR